MFKVKADWTPGPRSASQWLFDLGQVIPPRSFCQYVGDYTPRLQDFETWDEMCKVPTRTVQFFKSSKLKVTFKVLKCKYVLFYCFFCMSVTLK